MVGNTHTQASRKIIKLTRSKLRSVIYGITGHWNIGKHAERLRPTIKSEHKCCNVSTEDINSFHFWCECPSLAKLRFNSFGQYFLYDLPTIKDFSIETFVEFVTKSEWF